MLNLLTRLFPLSGLTHSLTHSALAVAEAEAPAPMSMHGSWFGVGDGTVIMWSLVWVLIPIGLVAIIGLIWAARTGHFRDAQAIAERQIELED
jgi:nitrogen fixation-related uncharacterized protein